MMLTKSNIYVYGGNLFLRAATIGSKFVFTIFLSKEFSIETLGTYSLFSTSILVFYYLISFCFDSYSLREIIQMPKAQQPAYIFNGFWFYLSSYCVFIPIVIGLFLADFLPFTLLPYFLLILLLEVANQAFFSLFVMLQKQLVANSILFLSQGVWILCIVVTYLTNPGRLSFEVFLIFWILGELSGVIAGFMRLKANYGRLTVVKIDWKWIKNGMGVSLLFFLSILSYKGIEFADRYLIENQLGVFHVGVYAFFAQVANLISATINVTVILMLYPRLIEHFLAKDHENFVRIKNRMYARVAILGAGLILIEVSLVKYLLLWLGKDVLIKEISTFYVLLFSNWMMNFSFIPHYCLYALRRDKALLLTTLIGMVVNLILNVILIPRVGIIGAAIAAFSGFFSVWLSKSILVNTELKSFVAVHNPDEIK